MAEPLTSEPAPLEPTRIPGVLSREDVLRREGRLPRRSPSPSDPAAVDSIWNVSTVLRRRPAVIQGALLLFWLDVAVSMAFDQQGSGVVPLAADLAKQALRGAAVAWLGLGLYVCGFLPIEPLAASPRARARVPFRRFPPLPRRLRVSAAMSRSVTVMSWMAYPVAALTGLVVGLIHEPPSGQSPQTFWDVVCSVTGIALFLGLPTTVALLAIRSWWRAIHRALTDPVASQQVRVVGYQPQGRSWAIETVDGTQRVLAWLPWIHRRRLTTGDVLTATGRIWDPVADRREAQRAALCLTGDFGTLWARGIGPAAHPRDAEAPDPGPG